MRKTILDTDILSEVFKQQSARVTERARSYLREHSMLSYTSVSFVEVLSGLYAKDAKGQLTKAKAFLNRHEHIIPEPEDYELSAQIIGGLARQGNPIGLDDPLIAACAVRRAMPLATGNVRHYEYIIELGIPLELVNWREL